MNLLGKITKTRLLLLFMTACFLAALFALYRTASVRETGTDYTITITRRAHDAVTPEVSTPGKDLAMININTATLDELQTLPGIGAVIAQRIIDYRAENGAFTAVDQLLNIKGIGEATLDKFRDRVSVSPPDGSETTATEEEHE